MKDYFPFLSPLILSIIILSGKIRTHFGMTLENNFTLSARAVEYTDSFSAEG